VLLRERVGPAATSLGLATLLWLVVRNLDRSPADFQVPLTFDKPENVVRTGEAVSTVDVRVLATKAKLRTLQAADFTIRVDNRAGRLGRETMVLDPDEVTAPFGVVVEAVSPSQVTVTWDRRVVRRVPVRVDLVGVPAEGHEVMGAPTCVPAEVDLAGPQTHFGADVVVNTERIDVTGRDRTLEAPGASLVAPGPGFAVLGAATADVVVRIAERLHRVTFDVPVRVTRGAFSVTHNPKDVRVTVQGPEAEVTRLGPEDIRVVVDATHLEPRGEDYRLEPSVVLEQKACPSCTVLALSQKRVNVHVRARGGREATPPPRRG
jgi:YbbR domain-containing protein